MYVYCFLFFVKQNTAYEMRISDWSSDVCSSDLLTRRPENNVAPYAYMGVSILHPRALAEATDGAFSLNLVYDRAEEAGRLRSEERRVGKECVRTCRYRWSTYHENKNNIDSRRNTDTDILRDTNIILTEIQ